MQPTKSSAVARLKLFIRAAGFMFSGHKKDISGARSLLYGKVWYHHAMSRLGGSINRDDALPFYEQLARIIAGKISGGQLAVGKRLPTELDLAKDYAISRETVRQAIGILERRGLVIRRRAKGTFIAAQRVTQDLAELRSFRGGLIDRGVMPEMELLEFRLAEPPEEFVADFSEGEVMRLLRRYVVKRKPLAIADIFLHPMAKAISWEVAERHDTYTIFGEFLGTRVARASATIRAEVAGRAVGRLLDLRPSAAVLVLIQTHYAASGEVLVRSALRVRADAYELHIDILGGAAFKDGLAGAVTPQVTRGSS
jgi:GntR family transcriptional regulator